MRLAWPMADFVESQPKPFSALEVFYRIFQDTVGAVKKGKAEGATN